MLRTARLLLLAAAAACAIAAGGGCLQTYADDGLLWCSDVPGRACPEGYYCEQLSHSCWHNGDYVDMAGTYAPGTDLSFQTFPPFVQDLSGTAPPDMATSD